MANLNWRFSSLGASSATDRATFRSNVDDWDTITGSDANQFLSSLEVTSGANVNVVWQEDITPNTGCTTSPRVIAMDYTDSDAFIAFASAHEAGHAHGMRHSGRTDNLTPDGADTYPLMGCGPLPATYPGGPRGDDVAQAFTRIGPRATPNWGFENGLNWWTGSSTDVRLTGFEYHGLQSALIPAGEWIRTRVRIAEPGLHRMVAHYRGGSNSATGTVRFQISMVGVDYDVAIPTGDGCPALNNFDEYSEIQYPVNTTRSVTTSWQSFSLNLASMDDAGEGIRGSVWIYNNTSTDVWVDNVALEER